MWKERSCKGITVKIPCKQSTTSGTSSATEAFCCNSSLLLQIRIGRPCMTKNIITGQRSTRESSILNAHLCTRGACSPELYLQLCIHVNNLLNVQQLVPGHSSISVCKIKNKNLTYFSHTYTYMYNSKTEFQKLLKARAKY